MKKLLLLAGITAVFAAACTEEPVVDTPEPQTYSFSLTANVDGDLTKTAYADDKTFSWSDGDAISVLFHKGDDNKFFTLSTEAGGSATATFTGEITSGYVVGSSDSGKCIALFPAGSHSYTAGAGNPITFNIPHATDFTADGAHFSANLPLCAVSEDPDSYSFRHMCGTYKFQFKDIDVAKVEFIVENSSRGLSGNITTAKDSGSDRYYLTQSGSASAEDKSISFTENVSADKTAVFYIPYRGWHEDFQPTITLKDATTGNVLYSKTAKAAFSGNLASSVKYMVVTPAISVTSNQTLSLTFSESDDEVWNPERGFYNQQSFHFRDGDIPKAKLWDNPESLVLPLFYFEDYRTSDLSQTVLDRISDVFSNIRAAGKKAIVRFGYINSHDNSAKPWDAGITRILSHINQVKPILAANEDIIYVMQAGFVGVFGEWYYVSDDFNYSTSGSSVVNYTNRAQVISALLGAVPNRQVGLRTAKYKRYYLSPNAINDWTPITSWGAEDNQRLGFYNDGFRGSSSDIGTFDSTTDRNMWCSQSAWVITGGETAYKGGDTVESKNAWLAANPDLASIDNAIAEVHEQHFSYLNANDNNILMDYWDGGTAGVVGTGESHIPELRKAIGYRLVLDNVSLTYPSLNSGATVNYSISVRNTGSAPVYYPRPFKLVLLHNGNPTVLVNDLGDIRNVAPGADAVTLSGSFTLQAAVASGDKLAIWLPDNATTLQSNALYSIHLANAETGWQNGYNILYTF